MAIQTIKCPNCGGEVQMNDTLESGFCTYCGGVIRIQEELAKVQIEHTGKIEIAVDDSKKLANSLTLADRAFAVGNYEECYDYCCAVLECDTGNVHAIFRKGLCAAYLSLSRVDELEQALTTATQLILKDTSNADEDIFLIFSELHAYIRSTYKLNCKRAKGFVYPDQAAVNNTFSIMMTMTRLCATCANLITDAMIASHPTFETHKKGCLELGLDICQEALSPIKYISGYRQVTKGNSVTSQEIYETKKSPYLDEQNQYQKTFKELFNNLPSTRNALDAYDTEIASLEKDIDAYNQRLKEYFAENPQLGKTFKKNALPVVIPTILAGFLSPLAIVWLLEAVSPVLFYVIASLLGLGIVGLIVLCVMRKISCNKARKEIISQFPSDLACLKTVHDQSQTKLRSVNKNKAAFVKKNVKK